MRSHSANRMLGEVYGAGLGRPNPAPTACPQTPGVPAIHCQALASTPSGASAAPWSFMNPFVLGLAAALAALMAGTPLPPSPDASRQPFPDQPVTRQAIPHREVAQWPVSPVTVVRSFEPHEQFGPGHRGVDLAATPGQTVFASLGGEVSFVGTVAGHPVVVIRHQGGLRTTYLPVAPTLAVGTNVEAGQPIGSLTVGMHCPMSTCLHWGARLGDDYVDPLTLMGREVVLLPPAPPP